jgi:hypothetical protein
MGYIGADGKYHKEDVKIADAVPQKTSVWQQSDHDRQRADHKADLVNPYLPSGEPNPEFIELYPEESKEVYKFIKSDEDIAKEH